MSQLHLTSKSQDLEEKNYFGKFFKLYVCIFVICLQILSCKVHVNVFKLPPQILNAEKFISSLSFLLLLFFSTPFCLSTCLFISYVIKGCELGKLRRVKLYDVTQGKSKKIIKLYSVTVKHVQQK